MEVVIVGSVTAAAEVVADAIETLVTDKPSGVLGLATGSSPLPVYDELIRRHREGGLSFSGMRAFLLDEYLGLPDGHPEAYRSFIRRVFADHVDLDQDRLHAPPAVQPATDCVSYDRQIAAAGGIDIQLLGVGSDGHIGFNEPSSSLASSTRIKTLTRGTREDNSRFFGGDVDRVPRHVVTQGIGTILEARHLILMATGEAKADVVAAAVEGPVTATVPASALQLHPHVTVVVDEAAASSLSRVDYYREVWANKPRWQTI